MSWVAPAGDALEVEADHVAARVVASLRARPGAIPGGAIRDESANPDVRVQRASAGPFVGTDGGAMDIAADSKIARAWGEAQPIGAEVRRSVSAPSIGRVQRASAVPSVGANGGALDAETSSRIARASGGGQPIGADVRRSMEAGFGADFSGVRVHTDSESSVLNERLQATAFTTGSDIFFGRGSYAPDTQSGKELLAHELTHTLQQGATGVHRTTSDSPARVRPAVRGEEVVQREFRPATTNANAHLRNDGHWGTHVGDRIDSGSEIVVDRATTRTQTTDRFLRDAKQTTWVKAVDTTADAFNPGLANGATTYVRSSSVGADKNYGATGLVMPNAAQLLPATILADRRRVLGDRARLKWQAAVGEYLEVEQSLSVAGAMVVHCNGALQRLHNGQLHALDALEQLQFNSAAMRVILRDQVKQILLTESTTHHWGPLLATDNNTEKLIASTDAAKALRIDEAQTWTRQEYVNWYRWVTNPAGPMERVRRGAREVKESISYWRRQLHPNWKQVTVTALTLTGSDLHEFGLGAMFVTFNKPAGGHANYNAAGAHQVVIKPENRGLERELFGTQAGSLASEVNATVGLVGNDQITTYFQDVHARYGTLCQRVVATQAKELAGPALVPSQAMKEALVFVMMAGLSDQHGENVLWHNGRPYMIDADNVLKLKYMTTDTATTTIQNGFLFYGGGAANANPLFNDVMRNAVGFETDIMEQLQNPTSVASRRLLLAVKQAFSAQTGRTVPIETAVWGQRLQSFIQCSTVGLPTDLPVHGQPPTSRWQWCNYWADTVPTGRGAAAPGLEGEAGMRGGGNGNFLPALEAAEIYADFTVGQIPFYNYRYGDGKVLHNGTEIWDGQTLDERMAGLFALFPNQDLV